eukprot:3936856-Rhodomonas_salina.1
MAVVADVADCVLVRDGIAYKLPELATIAFQEQHPPKPMHPLNARNVSPVQLAMTLIPKSMQTNTLPPLNIEKTKKRTEIMAEERTDSEKAVSVQALVEETYADALAPHAVQALVTLKEIKKANDEKPKTINGKSVTAKQLITKKTLTEKNGVKAARYMKTRTSARVNAGCRKRESRDASEDEDNTMKVDNDTAKRKLEKGSRIYALFDEDGEFYSATVCWINYFERVVGIVWDDGDTADRVKTFDEIRFKD